mmetsp:Transcript_25836/g.56080  ORF Transcript_25836/g.56080 Transcript_25836/m.56080 type:complete len:390 (-) Transcript_25836:389-1558(-)
MPFVGSSMGPGTLQATGARVVIASGGKLRARAGTTLPHTPAHSFCKRSARLTLRATLQDYRSSDYYEDQGKIPEKQGSLTDFPFSDSDLDDYDQLSKSSESFDDQEGLKQYPGVFRGVADDPSIHNPLDRQNRLGCGWLGALLEWEGVVVGDYSAEHKRAWLTLAEEEGKSPPLAFVLKKAEGMKSEQVIAEVLCWSRNPMEVRRLAQRKAELFQSNLGSMEYQVNPGIVEFLQNMGTNDVPCALATSAPASVVETALSDLGLEGYFTAIVTGDDVERHRPDPDGYMYAAMCVGRVPKRCIVIGNHNSCIEAAHYAGMKSIALANNRPAYELASADLVVRQLDELSMVNLKQLFRMEDLENMDEPELETELETQSFPSTTTMDLFGDDW